MNERTELLAALHGRIGRRSLVFVGIRGHDAAPLMALEQFSDCFAVAAPLGAGSLSTDLTLERVLGSRLDLDTYDYDLDRSAALAHLRRALLARLRTQSLVVTYRPSHFLWNVGFASSESTTVLGMYKDRQAAYEYKPWVETSVARLGLTTIPWRYVADESRTLEADAWTQDTVLRASRTAGGAGIALARSAQEVLEGWPMAADHLVAVGPYLPDAIPVNVGGCVYGPDLVVLHPGSLQLVGVRGATTRIFGYCGNDFAAFASLDPDLIDSVDQAARLIGRWLGADGYRGAFGVDFLLHRGRLYFAEINPRLQGSTSLSCALAAGVGLPDIVLDHVAATLGMNPTASLSLREWAASVGPAAHIVVHNVADHAVRIGAHSGLLGPELHDWQVQLLPEGGTRVEPGAILCRLVTDRSITSTGLQVEPPAQAAISAATKIFTRPGEHREEPDMEVR